MKKDKENRQGSWKTVIPHMCWFFGSIAVMLLVFNLPDAWYEVIPEFVLCILEYASIFLVFVSGVQMGYEILASSAVKRTDIEVSGLFHDIAKPTSDFIEEDQKVPVHETVLSQYVVESLVFQPKLKFSIIFQPEADKCTFLLSNGYSCTAEAAMVPENNYYIRWNTLTWNSPVADRLSKEDKKTVALAFARIDKDTIVWPFTDKKLNIITTRFSYY